MKVIIFSYFGDMTSHFFAQESGENTGNFYKLCHFYDPCGFFGLNLTILGVHVHTGNRLTSDADDPGLWLSCNPFPHSLGRRDSRFLLLTLAHFFNSTW